MNYKNFLYLISLGLLSSIGTISCDGKDIENNIFYYPLARTEMDKITENLARTYPYPYTTTYSFGKEVRLVNKKKYCFSVLTGVKIESENSSVKPISCDFINAQYRVLYSKLNYKFQKNSRVDLMKAKLQKNIKVYSSEKE